jgi:dipeptidase E
MRLLLGSGGFRTPERRSFLVDQIRTFFGPIEEILFVPYAMADHDGYLERLTARNFHAGYELEGIHRTTDPIEAVNEAEGIYVGGGNTFRLLDELYGHGLAGAIRDRVQEGLPYLGISAGTNVACPTIMTSNDMAIVLPPSLEALNLVPFQVNAHYYSGSTFVQVGDEVQQHFGETRDDRIAEFHEVHDTPVIGLREGGLLLVRDDEVELAGASARLFVKGEDPVDFEPGSRIWPARGRPLRAVGRP